MNVELQQGKNIIFMKSCHMVLSIMMFCFLGSFVTDSLWCNSH